MGWLNELAANIGIKGGVVEGAIKADMFGVKAGGSLAVDASEAIAGVSKVTGITGGTAQGATSKAGGFLNNRVDDLKRPYQAWKNMADGQKVFSGQSLQALGGWGGVGKTAGTYMGAAMIPRALDGSLNPTVNANGESDIVGIPFI